MNIVALGLALGLMLASWWLFSTASLALRGGVLTINVGFALWYWLPALNVLVIGYTGAGSFAVPAAAAARAAWLVLGYHAAALAACRGLQQWTPPDPKTTEAAPPPLTLLAGAILVSSVALVFVRFPGWHLALQILTGTASARDHLTFFNRSSGAVESLTKLWEILNLWAALFVLAAAAGARRLLGPPALLAAAAIVAGFLGSGTRSVLLMAIFTVGTAVALRPGGTGVARTPRTGIAAVAALAALATLAATALAGRFKDGIVKVFADTLLVNTDMFSETAFVLARFPGYAPHRVGDFMLTPLTFLLPRFAGFAKSTPEHLIAYNRVRAGYDIVNGQGNVFPGIVGDFEMVFGGVAGAVLFALFIVAVIGAICLPGRALAPGATRRAWQVAVLAFVLVSLRNIQGSLVLVMLAGLALAWTVQRPGRRA